MNFRMEQHKSCRYNLLIFERDKLNIKLSDPQFNKLKSAM